ncbi:MAG: hypothetical protein Q4G64_10670, partial [bacterium]|nr:hypothetical protein [bacterium]
MSVPASAAVPETYEAACADFGCAASFPNDVEAYLVGTPVTSNVTVNQDVTLPVSLYLVDMVGYPEALANAANIGSLVQVAGPVDVTGVAYDSVPATFTPAGGQPGGYIIVAPSGLTLAEAQAGNVLPTTPGIDTTNVSMRLLVSEIGTFEYLTAGADVYTEVESVTIDVADLDDPAQNIFFSAVRFANDGDVYATQLLIEGQWVNVQRTGVSGGVDYDAPRTVRGATASVAWTVPENVAPGTYDVRILNETAGVAGDVTRTLTVTGPAPEPTPEP